MNIGNKLRGLRNEMGYSTLEVSDMIGVSESTYRRFETDRSVPDVYQISKIAKIYKKTIMLLLPAQNIIIVNEQEVDGTATTICVNELSKRLAEQYEFRIKNLEQQIADLKDKVEL